MAYLLTSMFYGCYHYSLWYMFYAFIHILINKAIEITLVIVGSDNDFLPVR